jgi:hypothetical protein
MDSGISTPLRAGRRSAEFHTLGRRVRLPGPRCLVLWSNGTTSGSQPEDGGSTPPGTIRFDLSGPQVLRRHASMVRRRSGFNSRADLSSVGGFRFLGGSSSGKTPALQAGNRGSTPRLSTVYRRFWKGAGYGSPGRGANACSREIGIEGSNPSPSARVVFGIVIPGGEADDHPSVLTRCPGFESRPGESGRLWSRVCQRSTLLLHRP